MKLALLFNERPPYGPAASDDMFEEYDSIETVEDIAGALRRLDLEVQPLPADRKLAERLEKGRYDFVFNIAEGPLDLVGRSRRCREAIPVAICELMGVPYTGSDPLTLAATLDKAIARRIVSPEVPVAAGVLVEGEADLTRLAGLTYPVIVKPNDEGSSKGIRNNCVAANLREAVERVRELQNVYECPVLIEEFLAGAEVTVGVTGNGDATRILGMMEIGPAVQSKAESAGNESADGPASNTAPFVYSLEVKRDWRRQVAYHVPPRLSAVTLDRLRSGATAAYRLLGCRDIARMDFRLDSSGRPRFIECNPLPGLNRETGDIVLLSRDTLPYEKLVQNILLEAAQRTGVRLHESADSAHAAPHHN